VPIDLLCTSSGEAITVSGGPSVVGGHPVAFHFPGTVTLTAWVPRRSACSDILQALAADLQRLMDPLVTSVSHVGSGAGPVTVSLTGIPRAPLSSAAAAVERDSTGPLTQARGVDGSAARRRVNAGRATCWVAPVVASAPAPSAATAATAAASGARAGAGAGAAAGGGKARHLMFACKSPSLWVQHGLYPLRCVQGRETKRGRKKKSIGASRWRHRRRRGRPLLRLRPPALVHLWRTDRRREVVGAPS
jgi:hypothetical protein